jgi:hypothetical protein
MLTYADAGTLGGCQPASNRDCLAPTTPRCNLVLKPPEFAHRPVVRLFGPMSIGVCDELRVDVVVSWGTGMLTYADVC